MSRSDFELMEKHLNLHPSTVQYAQRAMKASKFWGPDRNTLRNLFLLPKSRMQANQRLRQ
jgi:hypothetical protein